MERPSVSDLIKQLEPLLRKFEDDDGLTITHVEEEAGCKVGDNYMSVVMQTTVNGIFGNGRSYEKSFMIKCLPLHREITALLRVGDLFQNESYVYRQLLPILGNFSPPCVHADETKIIMQDMKVLGYVVMDRRNLLDFDHCVATIQTLARFHASSLILKFKDPSGFLELIKPIQEVVFPNNDNPSLGHSIEYSVKIAIKHLDWIKPKSEEIEKGIEFLKGFEDKVYQEMQNLVLPGKGKFDVLTHGDCWNNNMMFKHDKDGKILDVKLLDFQMTRHVSPAIDFHYFLYSSPKSVVIEKHYDDLVNAYYSKFIEILKEEPKFPDHLMKQLTLGWFKEELKTYAKYGMFTGCWIVQAILADDDEVMDMDKFTMKDFEQLKKKEVKIIPKVAEKIRCFVTDYIRRYI